MRHTWRRLCCLTYWRPRYWKDIKFNRYLWRDVREGYANLLQEERNLESFLSRHTGDEFTMERASKTISNVTNAWIRVKVSGYSFQDIEHKSLELTPKELAIYTEYREAAYKVFHRCCEMIFNAQIVAGQITPLEWAESMQTVRNCEYLSSR